MTAFSPSRLVNQLNALGSSADDISVLMLNAGVEPLKREIKTGAAKHSRSGGLVNSVKPKKAKKGKDGNWSQRVEFDGYDNTREPTKSDPRGVPHARKAMSLEYGTSKQPATPFIRPAVQTTEQEVIDEMQSVFDREAARLER